MSGNYENNQGSYQGNGYDKSRDRTEMNWRQGGNSGAGNNGGYSSFDRTKKNNWSNRGTGGYNNGNSGYNGGSTYNNGGNNDRWAGLANSKPANNNWNQAPHWNKSSSQGGGRPGGFSGNRRNDSYNKRNFGSRNDSYNDGNFRNSRSSYEFGSAPVNIDWDSMANVEKNFYNESEEVANRSANEVKEYYKSKSVTVHGGNCKNPVVNFHEPNFPPQIMSKLMEQNFEEPTAIQAISWPNVLSGRDLIGIAKTGSGKTLAFLLPALVHVQAQKKLVSNGNPIAVVILPTRELAQQVESVIKDFANPREVRHVCIYGGAPRGNQLRSLDYGCDLLVATPGRLIDFLESRKVCLQFCSYLVLDEADRMLDMGFEPQIRKVITYIRKDRQTLMWSATWPEKIRRLASDFLKDPIHFQVGSTQLSANHDITQHIYVCREHEKRHKLLQLLYGIMSQEDNKTIVFIETKRKCNEVAWDLYNENFNVSSIHGDKSQVERNQAISDFRSGRTPILVATDVASRGLDVYDVRYVINYDFPNEIENYVQRIGRTARAGQLGTSHSFFTRDNSRVAGDLVKVLQEAKQVVSDDLLSYCGFRGGGGGGGGRYNNRRNNYHHSSYGASLNGGGMSAYPDSDGGSRFVMMPGGPVPM